MRHKSNPKPSSGDASEFLDLVDSVSIKNNALVPGFIIDYDDVVREKVKSHKFYAWLISTDEFPRIFPYLKKKHLTGEFPDSIDIHIARCAALVYIRYCRFYSHPDRLIRTTQATSEKALKHIVPM